MVISTAMNVTDAMTSAPGACIPTIKAVFVDLSYPAEPPKSAERDIALSVDTALAPALLVGYEHPPEIGACMAELATSAAKVQRLLSDVLDH